MRPQSTLISLLRHWKSGHDLVDPQTLCGRTRQAVSSAFSSTVSVAKQVQTRRHCQALSTQVAAGRILALGKSPILETFHACILIDAFSGIFQGQVSVNSPDPGPGLGAGCTRRRGCFTSTFEIRTYNRARPLPLRGFGSALVGPHFSQPRDVWLLIACFRWAGVRQMVESLDIINIGIWCIFWALKRKPICVSGLWSRRHCWSIKPSSRRPHAVLSKDITREFRDARVRLNLVLASPSFAPASTHVLRRAS